MTISFTCAEEHTTDLVAKVLARVDSVRVNGFDPLHISAIQEAERIAHETELAHNSYWLGKLCSLYQSGLYNGDIAQTLLHWAIARKAVWESLTHQGLTMAFNEIFPAETSRYTVLTLAPQPASVFQDPQAALIDTAGRLAAACSPPSWLSASVGDAFGEIAQAFAGPRASPPPAASAAQPPVAN